MDFPERKYVAVVMRQPRNVKYSGMSSIHQIVLLLSSDCYQSHAQSASRMQR